MNTNGKARRLEPSREREIVELAEFIADEYHPTGLRVDPKVIVQRKGITVSYGYYENSFDGLLEHKSGRFHIYCNLSRVETVDSPRARYTLGHELGHFFIDEHRNALLAGRAPAHPSSCEFESKNLVEREADLFSANLLMPEGRFLKRAKRLPAGLRTICSLANQFGTSVTSTAIRYVSLKVRPAVVIKWGKTGYGWKWLSYDAREAGYRKTIEAIKDVVPGSATAEALAGKPLPKKGFFESGTTAASWFPYIPGGAWRNILLIEQAIPLGRFGTLTFLYPESGSFPGVAE